MKARSVRRLRWPNQIRAGIDLNGNEKVEPVLGEGGALTAYEHVSITWLIC
jgi:hypothetical protein